MTTGSDLDKPLGQNRKSGSSKSGSGLSAGHWAIAAVFVLIFAGAGFFAFQKEPVRGLQSQQASDTTSDTQSATASIATESARIESETPGKLSGTSGADIQNTLTDDGSTVTKVTPRDRSESGPVILSGGNSVGQNLMVAHLPIPELLEKSEFGRLPVIGSDGQRPMDAYARPWSGARGTRIAIVIGGLGLSQTGTQYAIKTLPDDITLAFAASGNSLQRWLQEARRAGHEVLLQVPFEPFDYPQNDPGPHTLVVADGAQQNLADFHWALGRISNYTGIMNFMGGRFLSDADATEPIMRDMARRGLLFLDDGTSAQTITGTMAGAVGVPYAEGDMVIDSNVNRVEIMKRLDDIERTAQRNGTAIAIGSAFTDTVDAVAAWANEARARGVEIVAVSALVDEPERN